MPRLEDDGPLRLYFVRHGESEANSGHVFSNRDLPHGLTPRGRTQMQNLAERLCEIPFTSLYSSPILRARQSAEILGNRLGLPLAVTPALAEFDVGVLEGRSDAASWRRYEDLMDAWLIRGEWQARIDGGESLQDIVDRFSLLINALRADPPRGPVLLVGHGGTFICVLPHLVSNLSVDLARRKSLGHGEAVIVEMGGEELRCLEWGASMC